MLGLAVVGSAGDKGVDRLRLLASAIGGRTLEVADGGPGEPAWTDGTTVFVDARATPAEQVQVVGVQASLLAAGSLEARVVRQLGRRSAVARRYLAVEGHRALAANDELLPAVVRALIDREVSSRVDSAEASLAIARGGRVLDDPPGAFGTIRPRRVLDALERAEAAGTSPDQARRQDA